MFSVAKSSPPSFPSSIMPISHHDHLSPLISNHFPSASAIKPISTPPPPQPRPSCLSAIMPSSDHDPPPLQPQPSCL